MILTCPACATRYQADEAKFPPAGRQVRCAKCGNVWHQPGPTPEAPLPAEPDPVIAAPAASEPEADSVGADSVSRASMAAAAPVPPRPRQAFLPMLAVVLGWIGL